MDHSMTLHTALKQRPSWNTKRHNRQMLFIFKTSVCVCVLCDAWDVLLKSLAMAMGHGYGYCLLLPQFHLLTNYHQLNSGAPAAQSPAAPHSSGSKLLAPFCLSQCKAQGSSWWTKEGAPACLGASSSSIFWPTPSLPQSAAHPGKWQGMKGTGCEIPRRNFEIALGKSADF